MDEVGSWVWFNGMFGCGGWRGVLFEVELVVYE